MNNTDHKRAVYVYNKTRETFVATEATVADSYVRRLVGLLGKTQDGLALGRDFGSFPRGGFTRLGCSFPSI